jgi:hypothetical protein
MLIIARTRCSKTGANRLLPAGLRGQGSSTAQILGRAFGKWEACKLQQPLGSSCTSRCLVIFYSVDR